MSTSKHVPCSNCHGSGSIPIYTACPLCGSTDIETYHENEGQLIQHCGTCHVTLPRQKDEGPANATAAECYLGDSVYVSFDGYQYTLTTRNGLPTDPSNTIHMDMSVIRQLQQFVLSTTCDF